MDTWTQVTALGLHAYLAEHPIRCRRCKTILQGVVDGEIKHWTKDRICGKGYCLITYCCYCRKTQASVGPIGCPSCSPIKGDPRISATRRKFSRRMRSRRRS